MNRRSIIQSVCALFVGSKVAAPARDILKDAEPPYAELVGKRFITMPRQFIPLLESEKITWLRAQVVAVSNLEMGWKMFPESAHREVEGREG